MTILVFDSASYFPLPVLFLMGLLCVAAALLLFVSLNRHLGAGTLSGPRCGRFWAACGAAALCAFVFLALFPLLPGTAFGVRYWPHRLGSDEVVRHAWTLSIAGALAFWIASGRGLAGALDRWRPAPPWARDPGAKGFRPASEPVDWAGAAAAGAAVGLGTAVLGAVMNRDLFLADALRDIGWTRLGAAVIHLSPLLVAAGGAFLVFLALGAGSLTRARRVAAAVALIAAWIIPTEAVDIYLRSSWHYGPPSLAAASGMRTAAEAPSVSIVVLAERDGSSGSQYREAVLAAEGLDASRESLWELRRYLERRGYRSVFLAEAVRALRRGSQLNWEPEEHLDATMLRLGESFPPDFEAFLAAIRVAPATRENYKRLENMARVAARAKFPRVRQAQDMYEGFSAAYARFGDLEASNVWLQRIRGLWPLYDDDIHVEPVEDYNDGRVKGRIVYNGRPARSIRVGLFAVPSTMTVIAAHDSLAAATYPDEEGRFAFEDLLPGEYYLALQADPILFRDVRFGVVNAPGVFALGPERMEKSLTPIEIERGAKAASGSRERGPYPEEPFILPGGFPMDPR